MAEFSHKIKGNCWYILSGKKIGGAERRFLRVATVVSQKKWFEKVIVLVNETLFNEYLKDNEAKVLISQKSFTIVVYEHEKLINIIPERIQLKSIRRLTNMSKYPIFFKWAIKNLSWYSFLKRRVSVKDTIHCFYGDTAQLGAIMLSKVRKNKCIIELTSNRIVSKYAKQYRLIDAFDEPINNLRFMAVSETVHSNFIRAISNKNFNIKHYSSPFLFKQPFENTGQLKKENIIIFGHQFSHAKNALLFANVVKQMYTEDLLAGWQVHFRGYGLLEKDITGILNKEILANQVQVGWSYNLSKDLMRSKIFVSLISTGNYPSNSLFQAMETGNLLVLSDTGVTRKKIGTSAGIYYTNLNRDDIKNTIKGVLASLSNQDDYATLSRGVKDTFEYMYKNQAYLEELEREFN